MEINVGNGRGVFLTRVVTHRMYKNGLKRVLDLLVVLPVLLVIGLPLLFFAFLIKLESKGPVFFMQERLGKNAEVFKIYKFRSMTVNAERVVGEVFADNSDVTRIGRVARRFKIDELPQLINIVLGHMSIVGPRPCLPAQKGDMNEIDLVRLTVMPGLTGLAQINGNIHLSWQERWKYDCHYVENMSFFLDIYIIFKTILVVMFGEDEFRKML